MVREAVGHEREAWGSVGKLKGLRHWLCSSCRLLRGSQQRGYMYRHSPWCDHCFRSSKPRLHLAVSAGFFGFGHLADRSARL